MFVLRVLGEGDSLDKLEELDWILMGEVFLGESKERGGEV